jgi:hypothetical protein
MQADETMNKLTTKEKAFGIIHPEALHGYWKILLHLQNQLVQEVV